jgi:type I restriction enzyme M protein
MSDFRKLADLIWKVADHLRGRYKQSEYGRVILPLAVLRRLDCVLEPTKDKVLAKLEKLPAKVDDAMRDKLLCQAAGPGMRFYNVSKFTFTSLLKGETTSVDVADNLRNYIQGFPAGVRDVFVEKFEFDKHIDRLTKANLLYTVLGRFCDPAIDLHPDRVGDQARANALEQFKYAFDPKAMDAVVNRLERNEKVARLLLENPEVRAVALDLMMREVYRRLREPPDTA